MKTPVLFVWLVFFAAADLLAYGAFGVVVRQDTTMQSGDVRQDTTMQNGDRPERIDEIRQRIEQLRQGMPSGFQVVSNATDGADSPNLNREDQLLRMMARLEDLLTQLELHQATLQQGAATGASPVTAREIVRDTVVVRDTVLVVVHDTVFIDRQISVPPEIQTVEVELVGKGIFRTSSVLFEFDRTRILPASYVILDEIGRVLRERPEMRIEVQGHTDSFGTRAYNLNLSQLRAEAVRQYLLEKNPGIDASRIVARGIGPDQPIAENTSTTGRALNRRVDFVVLD